MSVLTGFAVATATASILYRATNPSGTSMIFTTHNNSADVLIGGSDVTSSANGVVIPKSTTLQMHIPCGETLYLAGNGTDTVKWLAFNT